MKTTRIAAGLTGAALALSGSAAMAGTYQALCGGIDCTVSISSSRIASGGVSIPSHRTTSWTMGGNSETDVTTGVVATVLFGPLGLLGFAGKKHNYNFTVNGYDDAGKLQSLSFNFINDKPAKQVAAELPGATGLGINEKRTDQQILAYEQGGGGLLGGSSGRRLGDPVVQPAQSIGQSVLAKKPQRNCWTTYLDNNPNMKIWADANPGAAAQNKKRFDDC